MLVVSWPIFVVDTKIIFRYNSVAPLNTIVQYQKTEQKKLAQKIVENFQPSRGTFKAETLAVNRNLL